jgi:hypothetical protein
VYWSMTFRVSSYVLLVPLSEAQGLLDTSGSGILLCILSSDCCKPERYIVASQMIQAYQVEVISTTCIYGFSLG